MVRPERRTRGDLIAVAVITAAVLGLAALIWWGAPERATVSHPLRGDGPPPPAAAVAVPDAPEEAWRAPSTVPGTPLIAADAVVTADGGTVTARDPRTGQQLWSYARPNEVCAVAAHADRVVAVYRTGAGCSEVTALDARTGVRAEQRSGPVDDRISLIPAGSHLFVIGADRAEVWRSDLVRTLEYGRVDAPAQPHRQPRTGCTFVSAGAAAHQLAVLERCPGDEGERLTTLVPDPEDSTEPEVNGSLALTVDQVPVRDGQIVAVTDDRVALAVDAPEPRLVLLDAQGARLADDALPGPVTADTGLPVPAGPVLLWWTGAETVALDPEELSVRWIVPDTAGPGTAYAGRILIPVADGWADTDPRTGEVGRIVEIDRTDVSAGPVGLTALGALVLDTAGGEVTAYLPAAGQP